jgi:uncharacterized protein YjdB
MQLFSRNKALAALSLGALAALGACGDDVTVPAPVNPPVQVTMSPSNANVSIGSFVDLAVAITGGASTPTLASCATSNAAVATAAVQGGNACRVTGVAAGSVSITATTSGGQTAGAAVTVNTPAPAIAGLALTPAAANLQVGSSTNGSVTITANPTTQANASVTLSRAFVSSNNAVATVTSAGVVTAVAPGQATITVTLTGSGTGLATAAVTGQVSITVSANPPAVTGVTVTPQSAVLTTGGTQQITATAQAASGITASLTYGTTNPAVANVSASGLITAVGPGTATITVTASSAGNNLFAAATATGTVGVIVNAPAQISVVGISRTVTDINGGATNVPVDISNVTGQIQIATNLATNGNNVSSVQLFACSVGATACPAAGQTPIAQQTFGAAGAASGTINFLVNTAAFTVASDFSSATTNFPNGQTNIVATITSGTGSSSANANLAVLNVNNTDGFAARHTAPARSALDAGNNVWFGGPGAEGRGSVAIVPVIYTPGRSVASVSLRMGAAGQVAGCFTGGTTSSSTPAGNGVVTFTASSARPWTYSFGASLGTGLNATNIVCNGNSTSPTADVVPQVTTWIDNNNVSAGTPAFLNSVATTTPVPVPAIIRGDWRAPDNDGTYTFVASSAFQSVAAGSTWVGGTYNFISGDEGITLNYSATENNGVGLSTSPVLEVAGCGSSTWATLATNTGADLAECTTDLSAAAYTIRYRPSDRLGNTFSYTTGTPNNVTTFTAPGSASKTFGVDRTAPIIRWSSASAASGATFSTNNADVVFSAEAIDDRAGLFAARVAAARANNVLGQRSGQCLDATLAAYAATTTRPGASFITAPDCLFRALTAGSEFGAALVDGYRPILSPLVTTANLTTIGGQAYHTQTVRVHDRAGNSATTDTRFALVNQTVGTFTVTPPAALLSATSGLPVSGSIAALVETNTLALEAQYGAGTYAFRFPAAPTGRTAFDNVAIASSDAISLNTPFTTGTTFYTDIEVTTGGNATGGASVAADNVNVWATNFTGVSASSGAVTLSGSLIPADTRPWTGAVVADSRKVGASTITSWAVVDTTAAFNSPAGGIKARVTTTAAATASPFARVDFYQQLSAGVYSYLGSVEGNASACTSGTCPVYISDNGSAKTWTYVLRSTLNDHLGRTQTIRTVSAANALNTANASTPGWVNVSGSTIVAVGVGTNINTTTPFATSTAGRGLLTQPVLLP